MKVTITNESGKSIEVELTEEQSKDLGLAEEIKPCTGYERVEDGEVFYCVTNSGAVEATTDEHWIADNRLYKNANYYTHMHLAQANARADLLMRQLRRYAAEHGGIPSKIDWGISNFPKYCIRYDHSIGNLHLDHWYGEQDLGSVYFSSVLACEEAIETFKTDLLWYFTEYQPMLYD